MQTSPTLQDSVEKIHGLDLGLIVFRAQKENPGIFKRAEALQEYLRFLELILRYPNEKLAPPKIVDCLWHTHILDTVKYFEDCQSIFGRYIHHVPDGEDIKLEEKVERVRTTVGLYAQHFGKCSWYPIEPLVGCSASCSDTCTSSGSNLNNCSSFLD